MTSTRILMATTPTIPGYEIVEYKGMVWGITVRCKNFIIDYLSAWRQLFGGEMKGYARMAEEARQQCVDRMLASARRKGANGIVEIYFDSELGQDKAKQQGASNAVTAYGTAVVVRPIE